MEELQPPSAICLALAIAPSTVARVIDWVSTPEFNSHLQFLRKRRDPHLFSVEAINGGYGLLWLLDPLPLLDLDYHIFLYY